MNLTVRYDYIRNKMVLTGNDNTVAWLKLPGPAAVLGAWQTEVRVRGMRVRHDPPKGERPPGPGILTPSLFAAVLQGRLKSAFPDETIRIEAL
jgi:hypothetical protein